MAGKRCEISTFMKDNYIEFFLTLKHGLMFKVTNNDNNGYFYVPFLQTAYSPFIKRTMLT